MKRFTDQRVAMRASAGVEFLLGDHLGSTSLTVPNDDPQRGYSYSSFLDTPRGQYIAALSVDIP